MDMKTVAVALAALGAVQVLKAGVEVVDCPKCERFVRFADDGRSATVNRARFAGKTQAETDVALTAAVRRAEAVLASTVKPDEMKRPLMGWSSWNCFGLDIDTEKIVSQAVAMASNGLKSAGYLYINTDDGFFDGHDEKGVLKWNLKRFPKGMKPVVDGIHAQGLKAGIYSDAGADMCGGSKGSGLYGHDEADCDLHFKQLGFDYIKVDYCGGMKLNLDERTRYTEISKHIRATGRDVKFNVCRWAFPGTWISDVADSWRVTGDIRANWKSVRSLALKGLPLSAYASTGHYNDLDMLEIGHPAGWKPAFDGDTGLSETEEIAHFGLWCIMSSPLVLGCDLRTMPERAIALVTNPYLLAMNANDLGLQAYPVWTPGDGSVVTLVKDADERYGLSRYVAIVNFGDAEEKLSFSPSEVDLGGRVHVVDLVEKAEIGSFANTMALVLKPHEAKFYRLFAEKRLVRRYYRADASWMRNFNALGWTREGPSYLMMQPDPGEAWCRVTAAVGLGRSADNDLLWRDVRVFEKGAYKLALDVVSSEPRTFFVSIDGGKGVELKAKAAQWIQTLPFEAELDAGQHEVRVYNDSASVPAIVGLDVRRK